MQNQGVYNVSKVNKENQKNLYTYNRLILEVGVKQRVAPKKSQLLAGVAPFDLPPTATIVIVWGKVGE